MYNALASAQKLATMYEIHWMLCVSVCLCVGVSVCLYVSFEISPSNFNYIAFSHFELVDG